MDSTKSPEVKHNVKSEVKNNEKKSRTMEKLQHLRLSNEDIPVKGTCHRYNCHQCEPINFCQQCGDVTVAVL